jgi:hypothetical protein
VRRVHVIPETVRVINRVDMVSNQSCNRRAWLHEHIDKSGRDVCIGPRYMKIIEDRDATPMILAIGAAQPCP